ncbi:MAG: hypothetical protein FWG68_10210 [Defluviitaleaceae bacterium]|nr:hypothetical protein [Defluviitaleaceae bacterium]
MGENSTTSQNSPQAEDFNAIVLAIVKFIEKSDENTSKTKKLANNGKNIGLSRLKIPQ